MNILEQEDIVKGMPDEVLIAQSQNPTGGIPQFLLVSEIQRREKMRANYQGDQQQMPMPTVTEQVVQQGIASLNPDPDPLMNTAMGIPQQPMMTAAGGGMMPYRMATGRDIPYFEEGFYDLPEELLGPAIDTVLQMRGGGMDRIQGILGEYARRRGIDPLEFIERNLPTPTGKYARLYSGTDSTETLLNKFGGDAAKTDVSKITPDDVTEELITMAGAPGAGAEKKTTTFDINQFLVDKRDDFDNYLRSLSLKDFDPRSEGFKEYTENIAKKPFVTDLLQTPGTDLKGKTMPFLERVVTLPKRVPIDAFEQFKDVSESARQSYSEGGGGFGGVKKIAENLSESDFSLFPEANVNASLFPQAQAFNENIRAGADKESGPQIKKVDEDKNEDKNLGNQLTKFVSEDSPDVKDYREVIEAMLGRAYKPMDEGALALVNLGAGIAKGDIGAGLLGATKAIGEERDRTRKDMVARATAAYYLGGGRGSKGTTDSALFRQALTDINKEFGGRAKLAEEYKKRVGDLPPDGQASKTALEKFKNFLIMERARLYAQMNQQYGGASFGPASGSNVDMDQVGRDIQNSLNINKFSQ